MRQFLSLLVIVALFGCISALSNEKKAAIKSHLTDEQVHQVSHLYAAMTPEQQASFRTKMAEGGEEFKARRGSSRSVGGSNARTFIEKAYKDSQK